MPELPEVETVRRDLHALLEGATVSSVSATGARSIRRHGDGAEFDRRLTGRTLTGFGRWGKYLLVRLDDDKAVLVVHLRMSGQLLLCESAAVPLAKHSHVVITFTDGRQLRFVDPRTFGEMFVTTPDLAELAGMGPDALSVDRPQLGGLLAARRARLKPLLLDQRAIAGIGNIYSDEILWRARLRWSRPAAGLRPVEVTRLHDALVGVLSEAVDRRGSSLRDAQYVDLTGRPGTFQDAHEVYARRGLACRRCGRPIERVRVAQRSHFWCRRCQR